MSARCTTATPPARTKYAYFNHATRCYLFHSQKHATERVISTVLGNAKPYLLYTYMTSIQIT